MVKHLLHQGYGEIRIFSRDEWKQEEMRVSMNEDRLRFYVGDVRDSHSVERVMKGVDLVFHAAALKQVPSCEFFPMQAVQTNVMGSYNILNAAIHERVKCVVALGTDKAVYPINAMGMTKALMEKNGPVICQRKYQPGNKSLFRSLRQCDVLTRLCHSSLHWTDPGGQAGHNNRPEHDTLPVTVK